jgi:hypothetical protein
MGRVYSVNFENVAVTAAQDFFEISPADDHPVKLLGLFLSQSTEVGDAAEEMMRVQVIRGHTSSGSGGSAQTPVPVDPGSPAAGFAAEVNNTTIAASGSTVILHSETFNERTGMAMWWTPETAPMAHQGNTTIVVRLLANPADSVTMGGTLYVEEL